MPEITEVCSLWMLMKFMRGIWNYPRTRRPKIPSQLRSQQGEKEVVIPPFAGRD
jgi:hypothetical protein